MSALAEEPRGTARRVAVAGCVAAGVAALAAGLLIDAWSRAAGLVALVVLFGAMRLEQPATGADPESWVRGVAVVVYSVTALYLLSHVGAGTAIAAGVGLTVAEISDAPFVERLLTRLRGRDEPAVVDPDLTGDRVPERRPTVGG